MKFSKTVVVIAWAMFAINAAAETAVQSAPSATNVTVDVNAAPAQPVAPSTAPATSDVKANSLRKVRQEVEMKNDNRVVEKLEKTRLDDEKELGEKIDKTSLSNQDQKPIVPPAQPAAPAPAQPIAPTTVTIEKVEVVQPAPPPPLVVEEKKDDKKDAKKDEGKKWYAGIGYGNIIYNGNVINKSDFALIVGTHLDKNLSIEGTLDIASFNLNNYWGGRIANGLFGNMSQYDLGVMAKYSILDSERFHPFIGAGGDYLYRQYTNRYDDGTFYGYDNYTSSQNTNAFNASIVGGVDVQLTSQLSLGAQLKYSLPIYYQDNGLITESYVMVYAKPLEETSFTSWLLSLKFNF